MSSVKLSISIAVFGAITSFVTATSLGNEREPYPYGALRFGDIEGFKQSAAKELSADSGMAVYGVALSLGSVEGVKYLESKGVRLDMPFVSQPFDVNVTESKSKYIDGEWKRIPPRTVSVPELHTFRAAKIEFGPKDANPQSAIFVAPPSIPEVFVSIEGSDFMLFEKRKPTQQHEVLGPSYGLLNHVRSDDYRASLYDKRVFCAPMSGECQQISALQFVEGQIRWTEEAIKGLKASGSDRAWGIRTPEHIKDYDQVVAAGVLDTPGGYREMTEDEKATVKKTWARIANENLYLDAIPLGNSPKRQKTEYRVARMEEHLARLREVKAYLVEKNVPRVAQRDTPFTSDNPAIQAEAAKRAIDGWTEISIAPDGSLGVAGTQEKRSAQPAK